MFHDQDRVASIRKRVVDELRCLDDLELLVANSGYFQMRLKLLRTWLEEVDSRFLAELLPSSRTAEEEEVWLNYTETHLQMTIRLRESAEDAIRGASAKGGSRGNPSLK